MAKEYRLTTFDNPYDPFDQFTDWYLYDCMMGYNTYGRLARGIHITDDMTQKEIDDIIENAEIELLKHDDAGIYKRKSREVKEEPVSSDEQYTDIVQTDP